MAKIPESERERGSSDILADAALCLTKIEMPHYLPPFSSPIFENASANMKATPKPIIKELLNYPK